MRLLRGGKRRGIRKKDASDEYISSLLPRSPPFACPAPPTPTDPCSAPFFSLSPPSLSFFLSFATFYPRSRVPFLRNFKHVVRDRTADQCRFLSHRRARAGCVVSQCDYNGTYSADDSSAREKQKRGRDKDNQLWSRWERSKSIGDSRDIDRHGGVAPISCEIRPAIFLINIIVTYMASAPNEYVSASLCFVMLSPL